MRQKSDAVTFKLNIGGPSIILLLLVFGLTVFAILSIRASYNELKLSRSSRDAISRYYEADTKAAKLQMKICETIAADGESIYTDEAVAGLLQEIDEIYDINDGSVYYKVDINDVSRIEVELRGIDGDYTKLRRTVWRTEVDAEEGYNGSAFEVLDPGWIE